MLLITIATTTTTTTTKLMMTMAMAMMMTAMIREGGETEAVNIYKGAKFNSLILIIFKFIFTKVDSLLLKSYT